MERWRDWSYFVWFSRLARDGFFVVGFAGVGGDPVVGAGLRRRGAVRGCVFAVAVDRDGAEVGRESGRGRVESLVVAVSLKKKTGGVGARRASGGGRVLD